MSYQSALEKYREWLGNMASVDFSQIAKSGTLVLPNDGEEFLSGSKEFQRQVRLLSGIIDSMTQDEQTEPSLVLKESRCNRVAIGSGASFEQVVEFILHFISNAEVLELALGDPTKYYLELMKNTPVWTPRIPFSSELCDKTHSTMISGVCPWCGYVIINE